MTSEGLFFELLQVIVGNHSQLSVIPTLDEWIELRRISDKQSMTGVVLHGIEKLPDEQRPPKGLLLDWIGQSMIIRERNRQATEVCYKLVTAFSQAGFNTCILKGQANHAYYGEELGQLRVCGDVDIWVVPKVSEKKDVRRVLEYVYKNFMVESLCWLHIELKPIETVPVEVHLRPSFFNSPIRNRRFLKFLDFEKAVCQKEVDGIRLPVLKTEYDIIFLLCHLFRHLIDEGVGLRQVMDYYFVLTNGELKDNSEKLKVTETLRFLGLWKFAGALMWVLREVFAMPEDNMICDASEKDGKFLLEEIMLAGNFGQSDPRMAQLQFEKGKTSLQLKRAWRRIKRNSRFLMSYPSEVIWEPIARIEHLAWRKYKLWKY